MPLTPKGEKILGHMEQEYGSEKKAEQVLYASKNAGTITGIDADPERMMRDHIAGGLSEPEAQAYVQNDGLLSEAFSRAFTEEAFVRPVVHKFIGG